MATMTALPSEAIHTYRQRLPIDRKSAGAARRFAERILICRHDLDDAHIDDVQLVADELVANAVTHGRGEAPATNVTLILAIWPRWTLIVVDDRDPEIYDPPTGEAAAESGRGLLIVEALAERFWWRQREISKTANAVVLRTGVELTDEERLILDRLEKGEVEIDG